MAIKKYKANWLVKHNGKDFTSESTKKEPLELTDKQAKPLLASGAIKPITAKQVSTANTKEQVPEPISDIVIAIADLDPANKDHFNNDKKPNVKALEKSLDKDITSAQRDEAWSLYQSQQDANT